MSRLIVLIGPSGAGKSAVANVLSKNYGFQHIKSFTTRPQRNANDTDHVFISTEEFEEMEDNGDFFGTMNAFGHSYGLPRFTPYTLTVVLVRAPAVKILLTQFPDARIIEIEASLPILKERLEKRGSTERFDPEILEKEIALGRSIASRTIDATNLSPEQVAEEII